MSSLSILLPKVFNDISIAWIIFYLIIIAFMVSVAINLRLKIFNTWIIILLIFTAVSVASVWWTPLHSYDIETWKRLFARVIVPLIISIIGLNLFSEDRNLHIFIKYLSVAVFLLSIVAICQLVLGAFGGAMTITSESRAASTFNNPNGFAIFLFISTPCILYGIDQNVLSKKIGAAIILMVIGGILCTASRKGVVGFASATTIYFLLNRKFKQLIILATVLGLIILGVASYDLLADRFAKKKIGIEIVLRSKVVGIGLDMFYDKPIQGLGYNGYYDYSEKYIGHRLERKMEAHNVYITILSNYGLLGFIPFLFVLLYPLIISGRLLSRSSPVPANDKGKAIICISTVIPFIIAAWFAGGLINDWQIMNLLYTCITFAIAVKQDKITKNESIKYSA